MNNRTAFIFLCFSLTLFACKRKKVESTKYLTYYPNKNYKGSNDTNQLISTLYIQDKEKFLQCLVGIESLEDSLTYQVKVCKKDTANVLGYDPNPYIDFGKITNKAPLNTNLSNITFDELFDKDFQGYYIVKSTTESSNDSTRMLIFSPFIQ